MSLNNLPNRLTTLRLGLAFVLFGLVWAAQWSLALAIFSVAAFTDWLDGYLARRQNLTSPLGRVYDPLVDKVLVTGVFIFLMEHKETGLNALMVTVVVAREFIVTGLRGYLEKKGVSFGADWLGKIKMVVQCVAIVLILLSMALWVRELSPAWVFLVRNSVTWLAVVVTFVSGANYVLKALKHLV